MRFRLKRSVMLTAPAVILSFAGPVLGSDQNTGQRSGNSQPHSVSSAPSVKGVLSADMRASRLIGIEVRDRSGEHVAEIEDLIIDLSDDRMRYAVIAAGGFLGIGETHYAFPMNRFREAPERDALVLNVDAASLGGAPTFNHDWSDFNDPQYQARLDGNSGSATARIGKTDLRRVSELLDMNVRSPSGIQVGELEDFLIDLKSGEARAVVSVDPGENANERLVAVPPNRLGIPRYSDDAVVNMTRSELMNAPRVTDMKPSPHRR